MNQQRLMQQEYHVKTLKDLKVASDLGDIKINSKNSYHNPSSKSHVSNYNNHEDNILCTISKGFPIAMDIKVPLNKDNFNFLDPSDTMETLAQNFEINSQVLKEAQGHK